MKLTSQEVDLFYKLMWSLQHFVNKKLDVVSGAATMDEYSSLPSEEKLKMRNAIFEHPEIISEYVKENPDGFVADEIEIVEGWKKFQLDDYFIERVLKKYAIFISGDKVYGVVGLLDEIGDIVPCVPFYCRAVLLPFKGKIIYDGLLEGYGVSFGSGIKYNLKETYMAAKQHGRIILSFDDVEQKNGREREKKRESWDLLLEDMERCAKKLRCCKDDPAIHSSSFSVVRASIEFARMVTENPEDVEQLRKAFKRVVRSVRKIETVLDRMEYFAESEINSAYLRRVFGGR